jgi:ketosteroid isomerase-like protein
VEWQTTGQFVEGGVYRGHDGVREFLTTLGGEFDDFRAEAGSLTDAGDVVVVETRGSGVGKQSGAQVEIEFTILVNLTEGRVTRLCNFMDRGKALEAAGLRE